MAWRSDPVTPRGRGRGRAPTPSPGVARHRAPPTTPSSSPSRRIDLVASVSRSGGIQRDGDDLKDPQVQDEYREYIQGKLDVFWKRHPRRTNETDEETRQRVDAQENVLILFRKLREGIIASKRTDVFSDDVYATSLYLSVLFDSPRHISGIVPVVLSYLCMRTVSSSPTLALTCLLQHLLASYPSQTSFHTSLASLPIVCFPLDSPERRWVVELARCLRAGNYVQVERLTRTGAPSTGDNNKLARKAIHHLVDSLRAKTRETAWRVIRTAYREVTLSLAGEIDTRTWLLRSLLLTEESDGDDPDIDDALERLHFDSQLDRWLEEQCAKGCVVKKEGIKWTLCRPGPR
ncbi:hypothetical protein C8F01DRAFT_1113014 [Mycena amicta]|nr:hypothetical protein C8F01DRAFT_1113014 [Mycena amicta]